MDYQAHVEVTRHASFVAFMTQQEKRSGRLILIETDGAVGLYDAVFGANDTLILGRESAGSPPEVRAAADAIVRIPMVAGMRSLNVAMAAGIALAEALRQTGGMAQLGGGA